VVGSGGSCLNNTCSNRKDKPSYQVQTDLDEVAEIESRESIEKAEVVEIPVDDIVVKPGYERKIYDDSMVEELAKSIEQHGLMQPILVRREGEKYQLISGFLRMKAFIKLGRERIPAKVVDVDEREAYLLHLTENVQRRNLSDWDFMWKVAWAKENYGYTTRQLAELLHVSPSKISKAWKVYIHGKRYHPIIKAGGLSIDKAYNLLSGESTQEEFKNYSEFSQRNTFPKPEGSGEGLTLEDIEEYMKERGESTKIKMGGRIAKWCAVCNSKITGRDLHTIPVCPLHQELVVDLITELRDIILNYQYRHGDFRRDLEYFAKEWKELLKERGEYNPKGISESEEVN